MTNQETCAEKISQKGSHSWSPCGEPAQGVSPNESPYCRRHLAMYKRRTSLAAAARAKTNASNSNKRRASRACELLRAVGIKARVDYDYPDRHTGLVTLDPAEILPSLGITEELSPH